ncbi:MAG: cyclic nucleotide-binding domain-containing protein [Thermodesulfobacteriota bacterium]
MAGEMAKAYLVLEKGLVAGQVFPLEGRVTIGRGPANTIRLSDPSVSRRHAVVYEVKGQTVVEDLGSRNGTFIKEEPVRKAILRPGDMLRIGKVPLRYVLEEAASEQATLAETQELSRTDVSAHVPQGEPYKRSARLSEAISRVPIFSDLDKEGLELVLTAARLVVFDRGKTIIRQGDRGKSLFIILDGKVRVFTYGLEGREIPIAVLSENQFFGEISFLTGAPMSATVQAVEEVLLCELSFDAMRQVVLRSPEIKAGLEKYYRERLAELESKRQATGFSDRRRHPRFNERLDVTLSLSGRTLVSGQFRGKIFPCMSVDMSISGIRLRVPDPSVQGLPLGCELRVEIQLPRPWGSIRCLGLLRNIVLDTKEEASAVLLGIEFSEMSITHRETLEGFLQREHTAPSSPSI